MDMKPEGQQGDSYMDMDMNKNDVMASYKAPESYMDIKPGKNSSPASYMVMDIRPDTFKKPYDSSHGPESYMDMDLKPSSENSDSKQHLRDRSTSSMSNNQEEVAYMEMDQSAKSESNSYMDMNPALANTTSTTTTITVQKSDNVNLKSQYRSPTKRKKSQQNPVDIGINVNSTNNSYSVFSKQESYVDMSKETSDPANNAYMEMNREPNSGATTVTSQGSSSKSPLRSSLRKRPDKLNCSYMSMDRQDLNTGNTGKIIKSFLWTKCCKLIYLKHKMDIIYWNI